MKVTRIVLMLAVAVPIFAHADSPSKAKRDKALEGISACLPRGEVSSRQCKNLNENVETIVAVYKGGDKSVLPTLFRFTYLTDFYDEALLSDPDGFLAAAAQVPVKDEQAVASGVAGGMFGLRSRERFEALRALLKGIPESSNVRGIAQMCSKTLETNNASFIVDYFPPYTFTSAAAEMQIHWYSREMRALGEEPLWPASADRGTTYRFTYLGAFAGPKVVSLTVQPDGTGQLRTKALDQTREVTQLDDTATATQEQVARFFARLDQAHFWETPTELPSHGRDGAEWMLEGLQNGRYRAVVRWCPDIERQSAEEAAIADAGRMLYDFAGHKLGGC